MIRFKGNPILKPIPKHSWESRMIFNAASLYVDDRVHILYRAMGDDNVSRLGYASSSDGYHIDERLPSPVFEPNACEEKYGCQNYWNATFSWEYINQQPIIKVKMTSSPKSNHSDIFVELLYEGNTGEFLKEINNLNGQDPCEIPN